MILILSWSLVDLGPLGLYEEIYNVRAPCTWLVHVSHALEYRLSDKTYLDHHQLAQQLVPRNWYNSIYNLTINTSKKDVVEDIDIATANIEEDSVVPKAATEIATSVI